MAHNGLKRREKPFYKVSSKMLKLGVKIGENEPLDRHIVRQFLAKFWDNRAKSGALLVELNTRDQACVDDSRRALTTAPHAM